MGLRVSGAAWDDHNFPSKSRSDPRFLTSPNYPNNDFTPYIKRFYQGPSAEFLDAFAWANVKLGGTTLNVKAGRFAWLPGEFLFGNGGSLSYSMAPKTAASATSAPARRPRKPPFRSARSRAPGNCSNDLTLMGNYTAEFRSSRISEGGTFWSVGDTALEGPPFISNPAVPRVAAFKGEKGDVALGVKWAPPALDGDAFSLWYRKFDDKTPTWQNQVGIAARRAPAAPSTPRTSSCSAWPTTRPRRLGHRRRLNYRKNMPLAVRSGFAYGTSPGLVNDPGMEGPRGNTIHFLASSVFTINKNPLFDSGSLAMQFDATRLQKITQRRQPLQRRGRQRRLRRQPRAARLLDAQCGQYRRQLHAHLAAGPAQRRHLGAGLAALWPEGQRGGGGCRHPAARARSCSSPAFASST